MKEIQKKRLLFVKHSNNNAKFVTNDINILKQEYHVDVKNINMRKGISGLFVLTSQFVSLLFSIYKYQLIYIWFADYHSLLPVFFAKVFGKKSVICAGGYEATYIPEINCGVYIKDDLVKRFRSFAVIFSLKHCSIILPVDETLIDHTNTYIYSDIPGKEFLHDGIKAFIPDITTTIETVPPGYDGELFQNVNTGEKEYSVVSAGLIVNDNEFRRKGFDMLVECAKVMKDVKFVLIGLDDYHMNKISALKLENLCGLVIIPYDKLINEYSKAKVFAQLSLFEGLPSTICEAMCCECIPVGSSVNGIPKIIDGTGFIVNTKSIDEIKKALYSALNSDIDLSKRARENILKNFSLEKRNLKILDICSRLIS